MPRIVISYRRADSAAIAGRIFDRLSQRYGAGSVFMDIDEIPFGTDFRDHIAQVLATCDLVVAVIGTRWLTGSGAAARIMEETDPVRIEVQTALERGVPIFPVLVEDARMPEPSELPPSLAALAFRNACEIASGRDFHAHVDRLIRAVDRKFAPTEPGPVAAVAAEAVRPPEPTIAPPATEPLTPARAAALAALVLLPQAVQFTTRTELFVLALVVSTIGVVALLDREERPLLPRIGTGAAVATASMMVQGALGVARASLLTW